MHKLEYILLVTSVAVQKGKIGKAKLVKVLEEAASASHSYEGSGADARVDALLDELHKEMARRFDHLMIEK